MSQEVGQTELKAKTQQLLDGPLKHIRAAAIAAALLPLASVAPASAQPATCGSGGVCGVVFNDKNGNGLQDAPDDTGIEGAKVTMIIGSNSYETETDADGFYYFDGSLVPINSPFTVKVFVGGVLQGMQASPAGVGGDRTVDSNGVVTNEFSVGTGTLLANSNSDTDFGFHTSVAANPGTGTPGYWKNHPEAWPVDSITIGTTIYPMAQAIDWLKKVGKDKTTTIFASYVSAYLNSKIGNDTACVTAAMEYAYQWLSDHPVGNPVVLASSPYWQAAEPYHQKLDAYNNGLLCVQHRQ